MNWKLLYDILINNGLTIFISSSEQSNNNLLTTNIWIVQKRYFSKNPNFYHHNQLHESC